MIRVQQGVLTVPVNTGPANYEIGCPPVCVLFSTIDDFTENTALGNIGYGWGVGVSPTQQFLVTGFMQDNTFVVGFGTSKIFDTACIGAAGSTPAWSAKYNGTTATGFQLDWLGTAGFTGRRFSYLAFIDDEGLLVADAGIRELHNAFTGNESYTGIGFEPEFAMFGAIHGVANPGDQQTFDSIGMTTGASDQAVMYNLNFSGGGAAVVTRTGMVISPAGNGDISLVSFDADGFTLNYGNALNFTFGPSFPTYRGFTYWTMAGLDGLAFGTGTQPGGDGTQSFSGLGFEPGAVISFCGGLPFSNSVTFESHRTLGMAAKNPSTLGGGTAQDSQWYAGENVSPTNNARIEDDTNLLFLSSDYSAGGGFDAKASLDSWDADGFTLNWDVNDAVGREFAWVAFEAVAFPPCEGEEFIPQIYRYVLY